MKIKFKIKYGKIGATSKNVIDLSTSIQKLSQQRQASVHDFCKEFCS